MITIEGPGKAREDETAPRQANLAPVGHGGIAKPPQPASLLTVGLLERALTAHFPREDAEDWDRMGLLVGDPSAPVAGVCVALDPTREAIRAAAVRGANVLLTHHPAYLDPPEAVSPSHAVAGVAGANVWTAVREGVALMNFHTSLDVSDEARELYLGMLKVDFDHMLVKSNANPSRGYGYSCAIRPCDEPFRLSHLAARCTAVFGRAPRVWGDAGRDVATLAFANGSAGNVVDAAIAEHLDCLVCGEIGYHRALEAAQAGLAVIELGHDASELPLAALLAQAAIQAGVPADAVSVLDQGRNWELPDSTRLHDSGVK